MSRDRRTLTTFRIHLALTVAAVTAAFGVVIGLSIFVPLAATLSRSGLDEQIVGGIAVHALEMHATFWPMILVCMIASVASGLLLYRRMTDPLVRFVRTFDAIARGESPRPLLIRQTDYLNLEADALNRMLTALAAHSAERERAVQDIVQVAEKLSSTTGYDADVAELLLDAAKAVRQPGL